LLNSEVITDLHHDGFLYAVNPPENPIDSTDPPPNLAFLEILAELSICLLETDTRAILNVIVPTDIPSSYAEEW
jgi:cohesin complex subunit SA-1/2